MDEEKQQDLTEETEAHVPEPIPKPVPKPVPKKASKPKPRMIEVRVIRAKSGSALVQWLDAKGMYCRGFLPSTSVVDGAADLNELEKSIPYGLPWEKFIEVTATPESIANNLRKRGVWVFENLSNMSAVMKSNMAFDLAAFFQRAKQEVNR